MEQPKKFDIALAKTYRDFVDMTGLVNAIRRNYKVMSWGAHAWTNIVNKGLRFKVQGQKYRGWIILTVNGLDLFEIHYVNRSMEIKETVKDIYLEDLIDVIDRKIERLENYAR